MRSIIRSSTIVLFTITFLSIQWGCCHIPQRKSPVHPEEVVTQSDWGKLREAKLKDADLGTIGLISGRFNPDVRLPMPKGRAAAAIKGAAEGAVCAIRDSYGGFFPLLEFAWGTAWAPFYALYGGIRAAKEAAAGTGARADLEKALTELKMQEIMRSQFFELAQERVPHPFVLLEEGGPAIPNQKVNYVFSATQGIDTVLEISVVSFGLRSDAETDINPPLSIFMDVHLRVIKVEDHTVIFADTFKCEAMGLPRKFTEWSANLHTFKVESERCCQFVATNILKGLFGSPLWIMDRKGGDL